MATYYSSFFVATENGLAYEDRSPRPAKVGEVVNFRGTVTVATNLATSDKIRLLSVPKGARLINLNHEWGDLDGGTALVIDLGWESTQQAAFKSASTDYQAADTTAAGNSLTNMATELVFDQTATTAADYLTMTVTTGASSLAATRTITFEGSYAVM